MRMTTNNYQSRLGDSKMKEYFTDKELACPCGKCDLKFNQNTRDRLNRFRHFLGFPIPVSSACRCKAYNALKGYTQTHATCQAIDSPVTHKRAFMMITHAAKFGFTGVGVRQHSNTRFIHLDDLPELLPKRPRPHFWSYK